MTRVTLEELFLSVNYLSHSGPNAEFLVVGSNRFFLIIGLQFSLCIAGNKNHIFCTGDGDAHNT